MSSNLRLSYADFFRAATTFEPYPYQCRVSERAPDFLKIATGLGKTEALVLAWDWRRRWDSATPRRLIYVLPMRTLVEQTAERLELCRHRLAKAGISDFPLIDRVMGGDVGEHWFQEPENPAIVIGTQDMLLSRALNRGYGMSRFQWPMTFGAVNNDAYWVIDEVQLHGVGAVTAAQLQAFRDLLGTYGPTSTTFASATLDTSWLETAEYTVNQRTTEQLDEKDRALEQIRRIVDAPKVVEQLKVGDDEQLAREVVARHRPGSLTLAVINTVKGAKGLHRGVKRLAGDAECRLLHSQFRPQDRQRHTEALTAHVDPGGAGRIIIATQVVEAGIDVSAKTLITEAAPWSSLVQRFGRCNRRGVDEDARIVWIDRGEPNKQNSLPYEAGGIQAGRKVLSELCGKNAAPSHLPEQPIQRGAGLVVRRPELLDLFDTSPDLSGHDVDVSPFIREADEFNLWVFWRDQPPTSTEPPHRDELCPAPIGDVRALVKDLRAAGRGNDIRVANQFGRADDGGYTEAWTPLVAEATRPGLQVWIHSDAGHYDSEIGFGPAAGRVEPILIPQPGETFQGEGTTIDGDTGSEIGGAITITQHASDTFLEAQALARRVKIPASAAGAVECAALWHDVGKAHPVFQDTMRGNIGDDQGLLWAKSPRGHSRHKRRGFRHELPSALAYLRAHGDEGKKSDLIAFLIAAHHGKLRVSAPFLPFDVSGHSVRVLGNEEGDEVPSVEPLNGERSPAFAVSLDAFLVASVNGIPTWVERVAALRDSNEYGPFRLAYLELLVRLADWRSSKKEAVATQ